MPESPFINDPFALVWKAFKSLYPDAECECQWIPDLPEYMGEKPGTQLFGATIYPRCFWMLATASFLTLKFSPMNWRMLLPALTGATALLGRKLLTASM